MAAEQAREQAKTEFLAFLKGVDDDAGESDEYYLQYATLFVDDGFKSLEKLARAKLSDFSAVPGGAAGKSLVRRVLEQAASCYPPQPATQLPASQDIVC